MAKEEIFGLLLAALFCFNVRAAIFTVTNNCPYTVWPGTLTGSGSPLHPTGFELAPKATLALSAQPSWSGRLWARTDCAADATGKFTCGAADCGSGQVECNGAGAIPPASLVEFTLATTGNGQDYYDISLVDGFNLPLSVTPQCSSGCGCQTVSCPAEINSVCPPELVVKGPSGGVISCKSACLAFNQPEFCCTGAYGTPATCPPTSYSEIFKSQCPQAYSYAYDDKTSTFTCNSGANYLISFCP